ncbi:hypothetical protein VNO77_19695 [Canavalia gladiata]|uniref:Uncharacterized protein n=1 Tax=Canavalia gladiata TaxID=3824 RepID=A0AAN9LS09_CANGL
MPCVSHLGHLLNLGNYVIGYDLYVTNNLKPRKDYELLHGPEPIKSILKDVEKHVIPGITCVITITTELENIIMDWRQQVIKLPKTFLSVNGGGMVLRTTCEAVLCILVAISIAKFVAI